MSGKMKRIWAPWRKVFLCKKEKGCIFCNKSKDNNDTQNHILERYETVFVIMNIYPYNNGHLMIVPYRHVNKLNSLTEKEMKDMFYALKKWERILETKFKPHGFNIGLNIGRAAGAGFRHFHWHIVPRWNGDSNFMPVIGSTKVINDSLNSCYEYLKKEI